MDLEETQILDISLDDETEDEAEKGLLNKNLVATLSLTNALHGYNNVLFPIYTGINKIGRSSECDINIESEFLSKHHCTIEYINSTHLIFDCGSRNKTKKNKMILIPEVRYELRNGDVLKFGNICFKYKFNTNYNLKRSKELTTSTPLPNSNNQKHQSGFENKRDDDDDNVDTADECDNESTVSQDLLMNADNEMAAMKFYDVNASIEDNDDLARTSDDIKIDVHKDEIPQGSISTSESLEKKILVESPRNLKGELTMPETFKADGDDKAEICHSNASTPDQVPPSKLKLFVDSSPEEDKKPTEGNADEPVVPQTQADSSMTPTKANIQTDCVAVFDTPFMCETPDQKDDKNVEESIKDANLNNPHFAAETQDIDEVSSHKSKRKRFTDSLVGSMGITEIPETPEKDQFDCQTPIAQASNLKLRNQRDSSNYSDDASLSQDDVELRRKLFFDDEVEEDHKHGGVDKDTPKDVCEDANEATDERKIRSCASTNEGDGVASLVSVSEDVESTSEAVTRKAKILINTEVGSACAEDLQDNIEKEATTLADDGSFDKEAEIKTAGAKCRHVSDESVDAGEVESNQNNQCDYKIVTEMLPQREIGSDVETITESERVDKLGDATCESKHTESKDLKSFQDECQETLAAENKSSDDILDIEGISKCPEEIDVKLFRSRNVSDVSLQAKSPSGNLFPKSYAHKNNALKSPESSKKSKPTSSRTQNLSLNVEKCKSPSPIKRSASLKQIASKKLLKKSTSLSRKKLFGNVDSEFELNCDDDQFDSASQRRRSKEDSVEEEVSNAKVIQSIVTESLSTSAFKKKLKEGSKNTKRKQLKSILADLKVNLEDNMETVCDSKESSSERRISTRCNKGKMKTDPRFVFSNDKTLENVDGDDPKTIDSEVALKNRKKKVLASINSDVNEKASKIDVKTRESNSSKSQLENKGSTCKNRPKVSPEVQCDIETQEKSSNDFKITPDSAIVSPSDVLPSKTKEKKVKRKSNARTLQDDLLQGIKNEDIEGDHKFDDKFETPITDEHKEIDMDCVKKEIVMNQKDKDAHTNLKLSGNKKAVKGRKESLKVEGQVDDDPKSKKRNTGIALDASVLMKDTLPTDISKHVPHDGDDDDFLNIQAKPYPKSRKSKSREATTAIGDADASRRRLENTVTKPTDDETEATKSKSQAKAEAEDDGNQNEGRKNQKRKRDNNNHSDEGSSKRRKCADDKDGDDEKVVRTKSLRKSKAIESLKSEEGDGMDCESSITNFVVSRRSNRSQKVSNVVTRQEETIKILFTGVREEDALKTLRKLGGEEAESVLECTHIISDQVRRTIKFLCGVARGIPIVSTEWLKECKKQKKFIDAWSYLINDVESERKFKFDLKESLTRSAANKLFEGLTFHITKNVKPEPSEMKEIIHCGGGKVVDSMPRKYSDKLIVISCFDDTNLCKNLHALEVPVVSSEFVMTGVLRHVVDPLEFKLSLTSSENKSEFINSQKSERVTQRRKR